MKYEITDVTPELAVSLLKRVPSFQRRVRKSAVARYAIDMSEGRWSKSPCPIVIDTEGRLVDGQHRLHAVVVSGQTVQMVVCTGAEPTTFGTIDIGLVRTAPDLSGGRLTNNASAAIRAAATNEGVAGGSWSFSKPAIVDTYEANWAVVDAVIKTAISVQSNGGQKATFWTAAGHGALLRACPYIGLDAVLEFASSVCEGGEQYQQARLAREFLLSRPHRRSGGVIQLTEFRKIARIAFAWSRGERLAKIMPSPVHYWPLQVRDDGTPDFTTRVHT